MSKFIDYYAALGLSPDASEREIKKAYQKIAKESHPDMTKGLPEEERKKREATFILATEGYKILKNPGTKTAYDVKYQLHQARSQSSIPTDDIPFWEKPNWGGYRREHRDTNNDNKQNVKKNGDSHRQDNSDTEKERKSLKSIKLKKGYIIFGSEILYSAKKLKLKREKGVSHYIMKNRGKALVAAGLAISLTTGMLMTSEGKTTEPPISENLIIEPSQLENPTLTIMRTYTVEAGDTLSALAEEANCTQQEIKKINAMDTDYLYYKDIISVPYHIPEDEIGRYTTVELYNDENLYDFAKSYETNPKSLERLNPDTIIEVNGSYAVTSDTIVVPTFAPYDYNTNKAK